jgi:hypothetical protein
VLAETINDWFRGDTFDDLLSLEEHLADLSDIIILFVESPGSFAELGAFARSDVLRPKTLAIIPSEYSRKPSFITEGPVLRLRNENSGLVRSYDWNSENAVDPLNLQVFQELSQELMQFLIQREGEGPKEQRLQLDQETHGHSMLLLADLIDILGITLEKELMLCLSEWGLELSRKQFKRYVYLLAKLPIIELTEYSEGQTYYLSTDQPTFIRYDFLPGTRNRDRDRIKRFFRDTLRARDPKRAGVFERYLLRKEPVAPTHA